MANELTKEFIVEAKNKNLNIRAYLSNGTPQAGPVIKVGDDACIIINKETETLVRYDQITTVVHVSSNESRKNNT